MTEMQWGNLLRAKFSRHMWILIGVFVVLAALALPRMLGRRDDNLGAQLRRLDEIIVLFAHPDDEVMFFLPLIQLAHEVGVKVRLLCMSRGNYDGLGDIRAVEFAKIAKKLKAASADILDDVRLPDGPTMWSPEDVSSALKVYFKNHHPSNGRAIFTFDSYGVSGHPNHRSIYHGIVEWRRSHHVPVYTLDSVSIVRKYLPFLDILFVALWDTSTLVAINWKNPLLSSQLMRHYESQNVWFRKLFSIFSRYSYVVQFSLLG